ncbi:hypothetical protein C8A03DRAFT_34508 [Achaetomium macrosporum]|uniref:Uncharacterized protein n=1 Tax=Achaetomium macrosporum TaxID=79813 RepID=A0AAN7HBL6_9PEZI|nr:hypothetical protein C8A03DRAFT_34508 [Achaetomium macrosporum]
MALADPAWAPDWTVDLPFYPLRISRVFGPSDEKLYRPSSSAQPQVRFLDGSKRLGVQLRLLGEVVSGNIPWPPFRGNEESTRVAFRRTLIADTLNDERSSPDDLQRYVAWFTRPDTQAKSVEKLHETGGEVSEISSAEYSSMLPALLAEFAHNRDIHRDRTQDKDNENFFAAIGTAGKGRVLFLNTNGFIGLGPRSLRNGDRVCIPVGGDVLWLIRPVELDVYEFVGECYVDGLMDGDVPMPPDSLKEIVLA